MRNNGDELLNVAQAARELCITTRAVQHRIAAGRIAAEKLGEGKTSAYFMTRAELERVKAEDAAARAG